MGATQTFKTISFLFFLFQPFKTNQLTTYKTGIPQPPNYPIGVKRVHVNSPNVEGTVFQTFYKNTSNAPVFNLSPTSR